MLNTIVPGFIYMSRKDKISTMLCPTSIKASKLINKYIDILFKARNLMDEGTPVNYIVNSFEFVAHND